MSGLRDTLKGGWHPKGKSGGKESWRGDFKGINQVVRTCLQSFPHIQHLAFADARLAIGRMDGKGKG